MTLSFADGALLLTLEPDHAVLTLSQPSKRNALSRAMWRALPEAIARVEGDSAKVLVIRGAGGVFAAGADISEFETVYADSRIAATYSAEVARGITAIARLAKPVVAAIEGACVGGGLAIALACDLRIAASDARLGITPARLGLVYSLEDTKRLMDVVGPAAAKDILFTGRIMGATEAFGMGLVNTVHAPETLDAAVMAKVGELAGASQWSIRATKAVMAMILNGQAVETDETLGWTVEAVAAEDFQEGRTAFLAKRAPVFPFR